MNDSYMYAHTDKHLGVESYGLPSELIEPLPADDVASENDQGREEAFAFVDVSHLRQRPARPGDPNRRRGRPGQHRPVSPGKRGGPASMERRVQGVTEPCG